MRNFFFFFTALLLYNTIWAQRLVLPGDHPDPSVTKIGDTYWASATTSNWAPAYPLLQSKDLVHWQKAGNVFYQLPDWADYYFWAPEITYENGKVYLYYSAHKKGGNLCVGVASADKPEGPYKDHGPLVCQPDGSIDAFPMRDETGKLYLIWKEDGNSVKQPTPIWAQELNEERTALLGEKKELFRNTAPWEGNLVEGVAIVKHGDFFYAIYAANGCCGSGCTYGVGVARAKNLLGPWEKYSRNPVLTGNEDWKCSGHGTAIEKDGRYYFLYHAYNIKSGIYVGRQGLLHEFRFTPDGWMEFVPEPPTAADTVTTVTDAFNGTAISDIWEWSVFQNLSKKVKKGCLQLGALPAPTGAFLGTKTYGLDYDVNAVVYPKQSSAAAGMGALGDEKNTVSLLVKKGRLVAVVVKNNQATVVDSVAIPLKKKLHLQMQVRNGKDITFAYSTDGQHFSVVNSRPIDGGFLPPWDRGVRVGLVAKGAEGQQACFDDFSLKSRTAQ